MVRRWPDLSRLVADGRTAEEIADMFGKSVRLTRDALRRQGLKAHDPRLFSRSIRDEDLKQYVEEGKSTKEIAQIFGVKRDSMYRHLRRLGLTPVNPVHLSEEKKQRIEDLIEDGWSLADIGREVGVSPTTMYRRYGEHALSKREVGIRNSMVRKTEEMKIELKRRIL